MHREECGRKLSWPIKIYYYGIRMRRFKKISRNLACVILQDLREAVKCVTAVLTRSVIKHLEIMKGRRYLS